MKDYKAVRNELELLLSCSSASVADVSAPTLFARSCRGPVVGNASSSLGPALTLTSASPRSVSLERQLSEAPVAMPAPRVLKPPSHKVRLAQYKAAALGAAYVPVSRLELRQMVRVRAGIGTPATRASREMLEDYIEESRVRPSTSAMAGTAATAAVPAAPPFFANGLDARAVAVAYEDLVAQGAPPSIALNAARARAAGLTTQSHTESETRRLRAMLAPRGIINLQARARMAAEATAQAAEKELQRQHRPAPSREVHRSSVAEPSVSSATNDPLHSIGFQTIGPIAQGAFSTVVRAQHCESKNVVAVKTFLTRAKGGRAPAPIDSVKMELDCLQVLQPSAHKHIANLIETHEGSHETHAIMQYCGGGSLHRYMQGRGHGQGMDESEAALLLEQISSALAHMHAKGIAHRDVKPGNVVFTGPSKDSVRLVDFGFATIFRPEGSSVSRRLKTILGTPVYMAPELVRGGSYSGPPVDVWALGCLMYELLHNRIAFRAESIADLNVRIMKGSISKVSSVLSQKSRKLLAKLLTVDATERITSAAAEEAFEDLVPPQQPVVQSSWGWGGGGA